MLLLSVSLHVDGLEVDPLEGACKVGSVVGSGSPGSSMGAREESVVSGRADVCLESFVALDMETDVDLPQGHNSLYLSQLSSWPLARQVEVPSFWCAKGTNKTSNNDERTSERF